MNRPRFPRALTAMFALLAASAVLAACGGGGEADPGETIESATLEGIESAGVDLTATLSGEGGQGDLELSLTGAFQSQEEGQLPLLDATASAEGEIGEGKEARNVDFEGGLTLLPNSAYVALEGVLYEVDPTTFSFVQSSVRQAEGETGAEAGVAACQEALGEIEVNEFVEGAEAESGVDVAGESTTKVSGKLDVAAALDQLVAVAQTPACRAQVGAAGGLPSQAEIREALGTIRGSVEEANAEVYVGEDDGIVRRVVLDVAVAPDEGGATEGVGLELDLTLSGVNEEQDISAPGGNARPITALLRKLGINPLEALGALQGEGDIGALIEQALESQLGGTPGAGGLLPGK